ncbi:MAG TPA: phage head closure protein [Gemmata sp.]
MAGKLGPRMSIGQLRQRIAIEAVTETRDEFGGRASAWAQVATDRAEIVPIGGREVFQNGATQAQATHRVRMRYRSDITPKHRLRWLDTNTVLNIVSCPPSVGSANVLELMCIAER